MTALISNLIGIQLAVLEGWWSALTMILQSGRHLMGENATLLQALKL